MNKVISKKAFFDHKQELDGFVMWRKVDENKIEVHTEDKYAIGIINSIIASDDPYGTIEQINNGR